MTRSDNIIPIKTLLDIVDKVPLENLDSFLIDLKDFVGGCHKVRNLNKAIGVEAIIHDDTTLNRMNDGKNDRHVEVTLLP